MKANVAHHLAISRDFSMPSNRLLSSMNSSLHFASHTGAASNLILSILHADRNLERIYLAH